jgi:hypothetical protein
MLGPFEHEVLEEVGEPGVAWPLVLRTDVVPEVDRDDGTRMIFVKQNVEAVVQRVFRERKIQRAYLTTVSGIVVARL